MGNICDNYIEVIGDEEVITRMFELVRSQERDWSKDPIPNVTKDEQREWLGLDFDFKKVIPIPEEFTKRSRRRAGRAGLALWLMDNWGTRSNAYCASTYFIDPTEIEVVDGFNLSDYVNPACAKITYDTSNSPATPVTAALSKQFPELTFKHVYEGEGMEGWVHEVWKAGDLISDVYHREGNYYGGSWVEE